MIARRRGDGGSGAGGVPVRAETRCGRLELQRDVLVPPAAVQGLGQRLGQLCCGGGQGRSSRPPRRSRWRCRRHRRCAHARPRVPRAVPRARPRGVAASVFLCRMPTAALAPMTATSASARRTPLVALQRARIHRDVGPAVDLPRHQRHPRDRRLAEGVQQFGAAANHAVHSGSTPGR